jgi:hypothetical protein
MGLFARYRIERAAEQNSQLLPGLVAELFELVTEPSPFGPDFDLNFSSPKRSVGTKPLVTVRDEITSAKPYNRDRRKAITRNHSIAVFFNSLRRVRNVNGVYDLIDRQHEPIAAPISRHTKAHASAQGSFAVLGAATWLGKSYSESSNSIVCRD